MQQDLYIISSLAWRRVRAIGIQARADVAACHRRVDEELRARFKAMTESL
jgi:hypothetical protein